MSVSKMITCMIDELRVLFARKKKKSYEFYSCLLEADPEMHW
jgi:hypothetical protein